MGVQKQDDRMNERECFPSNDYHCILCRVNVQKLFVRGIAALAKARELHLEV